MNRFHKKYDLLVDTVANRSQVLQEKVFKCVEEDYPLEKALHGTHALELLSDRLALAEHGLQQDWNYLKYKRNSKKMGIWF